MDEPNFDQALLSFEQVYEQFSARVFRFCLLQVRDWATAEDLASETMLSAYNSYAKTAPPPERVHVWLFRIARNLIIDHARREKRRSLILQTFRGSQATRDVEEIAEANSELAEVVKVLAQMKQRDRRIIAMRIAARLSTKEIAELLGVSENTATVTLHRALERFRKLAAQE
jgi:RNA polymerase sigma-70 factor (ECF subfamily)